MRGPLLSLAVLSCLILVPSSAQAGFVLSISPTDVADVGGSFTRDVVATWDGSGANEIAISSTQSLTVTTDSPFIENLTLDLDDTLTPFNTVGGAEIGTISFDTLTGTNSATEIFTISFSGIQTTNGAGAAFVIVSQAGLSVTAVPEPTGAALLSIALLGLTRIRRRRS